MTGLDDEVSDSIHLKERRLGGVFSLQARPAHLPGDEFF
jgi:hypothetical protein